MSLWDDARGLGDDVWDWTRTEAAPATRSVLEHPAVAGGVAVLAIVYPPVGVPLATAVMAADALAIAAEQGDAEAAAQIVATRTAAASGDPDAARFAALLDEREKWGAVTGVTLGDLPADEAVVAKEAWDDVIQARLLATREYSSQHAASSAATAALAEHHTAPRVPVYTMTRYSDGTSRVVAG